MLRQITLMPGDVVLLDVQPDCGVVLTKGAFLACESTVSLSAYMLSLIHI